MAFLVEELPVYPPDKLQVALNQVATDHAGAELIWCMNASPVNRQYSPIKEEKEVDGMGGFKLTMEPYAIFIFKTP